jgi:hypothetical protein
LIEATSVRRLGHHTNTKDKLKVQFPTRVAPNEESHLMLETKKVVLCTKANHVCAACGMFDVGFIIPSQIIVVSGTEC